MNLKKIAFYPILMVFFLVGYVTVNAAAASIKMEGDYVLTAVSNNGTLGYGSTINPGIKHDITGTKGLGDADGIWASVIDDYLTPGTPFEIFSVRTIEKGIQTNNNVEDPSALGTIARTSLSDLSGSVIFLL